MSGDYLHRHACPVCAAPVAKSRVAMQSDPPAERVPLERHGPFLSGYASRRLFFTYHRCTVCAVLYCPVYFSQSQLDALYARQQENMGDVPLAARAATQAGYAALVSGRPVPAGDYLELGPDIGLFAAHMVARLRFGCLHLYEPNVEVHPALRRNLDGQEIRVSERPYEPGKLHPSSVGLAVAIHVLDHVLEPKVLLDGLRRAMAPGALLFVVTHNEASLLARVLRRRWPPYTLQHPQLYSPASMRHLLRESGFGVEDIRGTENHFPLSHLVRGALAVTGMDSGRTPAWQGPTVRLRLGNIAALGRKPA